MRKFIIFILFLFFPLLAYANENVTLRVQVKIGDKYVEGVLENNVVTRQMLSASPLSMEMKDYNGHERIGYPPEKLSTKDAKQGWTPKKGDIALFSPWGNICVYVKDSPYSGELIHLGRVTSGLDIFAAQGKPFQTEWLISQ